ncbi:MAG: class I SAM-dependent methyltransferase [Betaproteobacteria bacterium]|nr:class I SAM-dependent methyltransferase [Betaproteobacteria bacterium]
MNTDATAHWDKVYRTKAPDRVSWYRPHLDRSIELILRVATDLSASVIDVGGGESTLVDDLLEKGYRHITVLDISPTAIEVGRRRVGELSRHVTWLVADVTQAVLPRQYYDLWHDRAVFHFLTDPRDRTAYVQRVAESMKPGGHVIVATFGPEGPLQCSGLDVVRYDTDTLHAEFGRRFRLLDSVKELHETPFGTTQQFLYCLFKME